MSMEAIKQMSEEGEATTLVAVQKRTTSIPALALLQVTAGPLAALLKDSEKGRPVLLSDDKRGACTKKRSRKTGKQPSQSSGSGTIQFNEKSIFAAAGQMEKLETDTNDTLENELKNERKSMEAQLQSLRSLEKFWTQFAPAWKKFVADPSDYADFEKIINLLKSRNHNNPLVETFLSSLEARAATSHEYEEDWRFHTGLEGAVWKLFYGGFSDPHYFAKFSKGITDNLKSIAEASLGNPALFASALLNGQSTFKAQLKQLFETVTTMMEIVDVLEGAKGSAQGAMFAMEALLMDLEQLQVHTNIHKSEQQQEISQKTAENIKYNLHKIQDALKKAANHHSGGIFGWLKDFFTSIAKLFEDVAKVVYYAVSGQEDKAAKAFKDLTKGVQVFGKAFAQMCTGHFKEGFEELLAAAILTLFLGPEGVALLGTKCGEDMKSMATLVTNVGQAFGQLLAAGTLAAAGNSKGAAKLMDSNKTLGEDMLANPALKVLGDVAMIAVMVASAVSGQVWLAGLMLALFIMSESGLMQKMTSAIATSIESDMGGKHNALAKVLADVIVIVTVTVLSAGAGAGEAALSTAADSAASVAESEGIEMVDMSSAQAADDAIEEGSNTANNTAESTAKKTSRGVTIAKRAASMGAYGFGSTLGSSTLALDILKDTNKKDSQLLAIMLELVQVIVAAVTAAIGGFSTLSQTLSSTARATEKTGVELTKFASRMQVASTAVGAVSGAAQGGEGIVRGAAEKKLASFQANVQLAESTQTMADQMVKQTSEELQHLIKGYEELIATAFAAPANVQNAELQALIQA